jgi:hypothetical protein
MAIADAVRQVAASAIQESAPQAVIEQPTGEVGRRGHLRSIPTDI